MKKLELIICLILLTLGAFGQNVQRQVERYDDWKTGLIYLKNGKSEKHLFNYNPLVTEGLVQVKSNEKLYNLTVKDIDGFEYYDSTDMNSRKFMVFPIYSEYSTMGREYFLEIIFENPIISIVSKPTMVFKHPNDSYGYTSTHVNKPKIKNLSYFVNMETGKLTSRNKEEFILITKEFSSTIKPYLKENKNKLKKLEDFIDAIKYYEELKSTSTNNG